MLNPDLKLLADYPFQRLTHLLGGGARAGDIVMSIGEPQHQPPALISQILAQATQDWGKYPSAQGTEAFRLACKNWLTRRFHLRGDLINPDTMILPVAGTREALYQVAQLTKLPDRPLVLLPNPFYQVYAGAALMMGLTPHYVSGEGAFGLPDYSTLSPSILERVSCAYLCHPANPQGSIASPEQLKRMIVAAQTYGFTLILDECYAEIWDKLPPTSALACCDGDVKNLLVFHSLSKRSSVPGLRSGFVCGDPELIKGFIRLRSYGGAVTPLPLLQVATALWNDDIHVVENQALYRQKFDISEHYLANHFQFRRPPGGFFLWLNVGDGEKAAQQLSSQAGIRVLPGAYLAAQADNQPNPGQAFIRVALVHDLGTTQTALSLLAKCLLANL